MCWKGFPMSLNGRIVLGFCLLTAFAAQAGTLDRIARSEMAHGFSGAVLVARGDRVLLDEGYGKGITKDARFWIASSGKQFASAAILKCLEKGWLTLDDPLSRFFPNAPADKRAITIRQLLSHTSGLDQTYASEGATGRDDAVARMFSHPLIDTPGAKFHYSNDNYQLAAAIVEVASGDDYQAFVTRELFRPTGLRGTGFAGSPGAKAVVTGRDATPARLATASWGMEGVYSTTSDLWHWYRALHNGTVLKPADAALLFTPVAPIQEGKTALGWFIGATEKGAARIFIRGNEDWGPNSLLYAYPDSKTVIVVLTHAGNANDDLSWSRFIHAKLEKQRGL